MKRYDPDKLVDPEEWMALDEGERQYLVEQYHRKKHVKLPNARLHAIIHVVVENQIALGSESHAQSTLSRLMQEGLNRHDAVHAIGSVLAGHMFDLMKHGPKGKNASADYYRQLEELTAEGWLNSFDEDSDEE
jgi:hypothetical protein